MKVFITSELPQKGLDVLTQAGFEIITNPVKGFLTEEQLIKQAQQVDYILNVGSYTYNADFFKHCGHLKGLSLMSVGYDNVDLSAATQYHIPVSNTPDVVSGATADIAFLLMLAVSRKAFYNYELIREGKWERPEPIESLGIELHGKTLGIFGLGRIGLELARRAKAAYNMPVIYYNRHRNETAEKIVDAKYVNFDDLLTQSDVISVHCALTDETREVFNSTTFQRMKNSAIFINTARGGIHNENDLYDAVVQKHIWGAGLDVTNPEPMKADNPLLELENVCVLPHIGSATVETRDNMAIMAANNLVTAKNGVKMPQIINPEAYTA